MNRSELQQLSKDRVRDAKILLEARRWSAAYYLAGYAVECALKACIAKLMKSEEFPNKRFAEKCWTHNLHQLFSLAELNEDFEAAQAADEDLERNWIIVKGWTEESRYEQTTKAQAEKFFTAVTDRKHGVLSWLRSRW